MPLDVYPCSLMLKAITWSQVYVVCRASLIFFYQSQYLWLSVFFIHMHPCF